MKYDDDYHGDKIYGDNDDEDDKDDKDDDDDSNPEWKLGKKLN